MKLPVYPTIPLVPDVPDEPPPPAPNVATAVPVCGLENVIVALLASTIKMFDGIILYPLESNTSTTGYCAPNL